MNPSPHPTNAPVAHLPDGSAKLRLCPAGPDRATVFGRTIVLETARYSLSRGADGRMREVPQAHVRVFEPEAGAGLLRILTGRTPVEAPGVLLVLDDVTDGDGRMEATLVVRPREGT
jgi:hypothetical protein